MDAALVTVLVTVVSHVPLTLGRLSFDITFFILSLSTGFPILILALSVRFSL